MIYIVDFGSQVTQLIARRVRESGVYCEIVSSRSLLKLIKKNETLGIILSGGPASVHRSNTPSIDKKIYKLGIPILVFAMACNLWFINLAVKFKCLKKENLERL